MQHSCSLPSMGREFGIYVENDTTLCRIVTTFNEDKTKHFPVPESSSGIDFYMKFSSQF